MSEKPDPIDYATPVQPARARWLLWLLVAGGVFVFILLALVLLYSGVSVTSSRPAVAPPSTSPSAPAP